MTAQTIHISADSIDDSLMVTLPLDEPFQLTRTPEAPTTVKPHKIQRCVEDGLFRRQSIGLIAQYAAVGLLDSVLRHSIYPVLQVYLNMSGTQIITATSLMELPWSFSIFFGILSDCFPIRGYRRRPYMAIGWFISLSVLVGLSTMKLGDPYFKDRRFRDVLPSAYNATVEASINYAAPARGERFVFLMMLAGMGYALSNACADGLVCEMAQFESGEVRGTIQTIVYTVHTSFEVVGTVITAFAFNGTDYGGHFTFSLQYNELMMVMAFLLCPMVVIVCACVEEQRRPRVHFGIHMHELWSQLRLKVVQRVLCFQFCWGVCSNVDYVASSPIAKFWAHVEPFNEKASDVLGCVVYLLGVGIAYRWGRHMNWREMIAASTIFVLAIQLVCSLMTFWHAVRNQWIWLLSPMAGNLTAGISFIITTFVTVELAGEGHEGSMYGLLMTTSNLVLPFASTLTKSIDSIWDFSTARIQEDSHAVRRDVTMAMLLGSMARILGLGFLSLLPSQKYQTQLLKCQGGVSTRGAVATLLYLLMALAWATSINVLGMFEHTRCLTIAGGNGC